LKKNLANQRLDLKTFIKVLNPFPRNYKKYTIIKPSWF